MSPRRTSLAALALLVGAPVTGLAPVAVAEDARAGVSARPDAAHSDPDTVTRRLVGKVNLGKRSQARTWATRPVVRRLFGLRADGFRLRYPEDNCQYFGAADGYVCEVQLWQDGASPGVVNIVVRGPEHHLLARRAVADISGGGM